METLIGLFFGSAIAWTITYWYYGKAGNEMLVETAELRRLNELMLHGMATAGWVRLNMDDERIVGFQIDLRAMGASASTSAGTAQLTVGRIVNADQLGNDV